MIYIITTKHPFEQTVCASRTEAYEHIMQDPEVDGEELSALLSYLTQPQGYDTAEVEDIHGEVVATIVYIP